MSSDFVRVFIDLKFAMVIDGSGGLVYLCRRYLWELHLLPPVSFASLVSSAPGEYDIEAPVSDMGHNPL